jgi:hypothetical protein
MCYSNQQASAANPLLSFDTYFPPNKADNGGGYVHSQSGFSVYVPPAYDPLAGLPPKNP